MKKSISFLLTAALATSLSGCGNTSDSGAEDTPKEPVIEEIVITSDNLFDYFELYEEPVMATATNLLELPPDVDPSFYVDNDEVPEQYRDSQFPGGFATMIKLKDEYASQLDFNDSNKVMIAFSYTSTICRTSGDGTIKEYGDKVTADERFDALGIDEGKRQSWLNSRREAGDITDEGYMVKSYERSLSISGEELITGTVLYTEGFIYRLVMSPRHIGERQISEGPCFIGKVDITGEINVSGVLYLHQ